MTNLEGLLLCARCGNWKPAEAFHDSRTGQFSYCRECRNAYDRAYYAERGRAARLARRRAARAAARAWMASLKDGVPCADCGETQQIPPLPVGGFAECHRCDRLLARRSETGVSLSLVCAVGVIVLLPSAVFLPLMDSTMPTNC